MGMRVLSKKFGKNPIVGKGQESQPGREMEKRWTRRKPHTLIHGRDGKYTPLLPLDRDVRFSPFEGRLRVSRVARLCVHLRL